MTEIRRDIHLEEIPAVCKQIGSVDSPTTQEDVAYMTDLAWRNKWHEAGEVVPVGITIGTIFDVAAGLPELTQGRGVIEGKPQPSYEETLMETDKRLEFLNKYLPNLPENVIGVILGGSMSYGRFNNVRAGYPESSDLDLLLVVDHPPEEKDLDRIARTDLGVSEDELISLRNRLSVYKDGLRHGAMDTMSQKFTIPGRGFDISTHFIPKAVIMGFLDRDLKSDIQTGADVDRRLRDYKPAPFPYRIINQRDFFGNSYPLPIVEYLTINGVISMIPAYAIFSTNLVPGIYHNLCSPMFETVLDRGEGASEALVAFQAVMYDSLDKSKQKSPDAALSKSHIREHVFSRHIKAEVDKV